MTVGRPSRTVWIRSAQGPQEATLEHDDGRDGKDALMAERAFSVSGEGLEALSRDAVAAGQAFRTETPKFMATVAELHAERARVIVAPMSRSIPDSIQVQKRGSEVAVVAGGPDVPLAAVFERAKGSADEFRHPGPNNDRNHWYWQFRTRFFTKARAQLRAATTDEAGLLVDRTSRARGFPTQPL